MLPYKVTSEIRTALAELDEWRARLDRKEPLARTWAGRLRRELEAEAVAASTIMEGVPVTLDHVRRILAGDKAVPSQPEAEQLVVGYAQAMSFVMRRADDPAFEWNSELIVGLQDRILAGRNDLGAGRFRSQAARVVETTNGKILFEPPGHSQLSQLVEDVCNEMSRSTSHAALNSAWIHVAMAAAHPFKDGNGRACRVLASLAMYRGGFKRKEFTSLEEWWGRHRSDYYSAFGCLGKKFDPKSDVTPFVQAHIQAQLSQVRALDLRERVERRVWTALEDIAEQAGMARRVANALWDAFFERQVAAGYYRALTEVSPATATSDLALAAAAGLLNPHGRARARAYSAGDKLYKAVAAAIGIETDLNGSALRAQITEVLTNRETSQ